MKTIFEKSERVVEQVSTQHIRTQIEWLDKSERLLRNKRGGGAGKTNLLLQFVANITNSFLALDNIEIGNRNEIPLWLIGFLY
jgi:hypothetical protein